MPLPLPLGSSKHETKKSQSSKIVPSDHGQSEKREENYQAKISPSSPQGPLKKRSALEDLTNASQSQPVQPKKEANKEFVKDISKKINRNIPALELAKNNEMNIKKYEMQPSSSAVTTMVLTFVEKPLTVNISTISKTPTTEEAFLLKKPLVLKEKPTTGDTTHIKRSLSFKKDRNWNKASHLVEPLSLLEETESDLEFVSEPVTFGNKHKTAEETFAKRTLSFTKMCTCQGKKSCCGKELTSLDINVEKDSFMEPMNFRKKPKTEEATLTERPLTLNKCTTQEKMSHKKKPLILQKATSREKLLNKEPLPFEKKPTTEEFLFQESSLLQEKHSTQGQGEVSILKKPLALQRTPTEEESLLKEPLVFKKKHTIEEATPDEVLVFVKKRRTIADKISCLKKPLVLRTISEEKSLIKEPLSFRKKPTTEEEFLFKESSVLPEKHTTQGAVALLKKPWALQKNIHSKDEFLMEPVSFRKKHTTNEAISRKDPLSLKKKKYTTQIMMSICQEMLDLQNMIGKDKDFFVMEPVSFRKSSTEEAILTKTPLSLKKRRITQRKMFLLKKPLVLKKTTSKEESLFKKMLPFKKKPATDKEFLCQDPFVLKEEHITLQEVSHSKKPLTLQEKTTVEEESYIKKPLEEKPTTEEKFLSQEQFSLHVKPTNKDDSLFWKNLNMQNKTDTKEDSLRKPLNLQEKSITEEDSLFKQPLVLKKKLSNEATSMESQLSLKKKPTTQREVFLLKKQLPLQRNITSKKKFLIKEPLALQQKPSIEKESLTEELTFQGKLTINDSFHLKMLSLNEKPTTGKELSFEDPLALQDNPTQKEDTFLKDFSILQVDTSSHVFNTAPESRTSMSSSGTMSSVSKFNTTRKSSACKSSSSKTFSSWGKRSQKEITLLELIDESHYDPFFNLVYTKDIFRYMKKREEKFILKNYMNSQTDISSDMRGILVNWLVDVQVTFELNHETLYLAVKLVDHYLMKKICKKEKLQLLGSTAFLIAAKFEESYAPCLDDFLYVCDEAYQRREMLAMEISILKALKFDINIPVAYHFLRMYSMSVQVNTNAVILSRFICELTLQEYDYIQERASKLAAGSFLLALHMKKLGHLAPSLEYYSGYTTSDLYPLVKKLNTLLTLHPWDDRLRTVRSKYSHQLFCEVTKIPPLDKLKLDEILNSC